MPTSLTGECFGRSPEAASTGRYTGLAARYPPPGKGRVLAASQVVADQPSLGWDGIKVVTNPRMASTAVNVPVGLCGNGKQYTLIDQIIRVRIIFSNF